MSEAEFVAQSYVRQGLAAYQYDRCKTDAKVCLHIGNLGAAIFNTQVALHIHRMTKHQ